MDIISQLQEQVNAMGLLILNTFGTLQRDAPPVRLSPNYPEPAANASEETIDIMEHPKTMSAALVEAAKKFDVLVTALPLSGEEAQLKRIAELQLDGKGYETVAELITSLRNLRLALESLISEQNDLRKYFRDSFCKIIFLSLICLSLVVLDYFVSSYEGFVGPDMFEW
ncbi:hypothetical protein ZIOFF_009662 [Zingiber officinale]|uniref:Mediator of RNA polymerase II transcription subunit 21 n=1 Tax=Zingiber officinale TaxID=94328 RepID=A0A8J5LJJ9_ZINOF|nr:hypothetical protein ZIOFF_009662 [Zingiber officinale]